MLDKFHRLLGLSDSDWQRTMAESATVLDQVDLGDDAADPDIIRNCT